MITKLLCKISAIIVVICNHGVVYAQEQKADQHIKNIVLVYGDFTDDYSLKN